MILRFHGEVHDYDLELLRDVLVPLDSWLTQVCDDSVMVEDPDAFGYFDRAEHVAGMGFVACQTYLTATVATLGLDRGTALSKGPSYAGRTVVSVVNDAANFWKHNAEWVAKPRDTRRARIIEAFDDIGFPVDSNYPLSGVLSGLTTPRAARFESLVPLLVAWRDGLLRPTEAS